jgi:hypothetical protein
MTDDLDQNIQATRNATDSSGDIRLMDSSESLLERRVVMSVKCYLLVTNKS